ncbi:DNA helicase [Devosia sp.]|uniref:DNA helicase n=1 Tax=Devosia sp. TaxID=1871048 RepID=UPI0032666667
MHLSAPIYQLKRHARRMAREHSIPLNQALDRVAAEQGYTQWSLLAARHEATTPAAKLYQTMQPGDLVLVAARPRQGKTLLALELAAEAARSSGKTGAFFTLEYTDKDVLVRLQAIGCDPAQFDGRLSFDCSDAICADYIIEKMQDVAPSALIVVDYLQLLDQRREHQSIGLQIRALKAFANANRLMMVFIAQVDRSYDPTVKAIPDLDDVRLPNPLDLTLFNRTCFLHQGEIRFQTAH